MRLRTALYLAILGLAAAAPAARAQQEEELPPVTDPLRPFKDIEVGRYYMKKGNVDAAIDRFLDATKLRPAYAVGWQCLAEAYEKKGEKEEAIKAYDEYLKILPRGPESDKIRKRRDTIQKELVREKKKSGK